MIIDLARYSSSNLPGFGFGLSFDPLYASTGPPPDTTPDQFTFTDATGVDLSTVYTSNAITVTGISAAANISITGGTYSINGGTYTSSSGTVSLNDIVTVRVTSSGSALTTVSATLTIDTVSDTFSVTTADSGGATYPYFYSRRR